MTQPSARMNLLRMVLAIWVLLIFVLFYRFSIRQIGFSISGKDGAYHASAGSHPVLLGWSIIAVILFLAIMHIEAETSEDGIPGLRRRFLAFLIDFLFSLAVTSTFAAMIALLIEYSHAKQFAWSFERNYSLPTDNTILFPLVVLTMALMFSLFRLAAYEGETDCWRIHNAPLDHSSIWRQRMFHLPRGRPESLVRVSRSHLVRSVQAKPRRSRKNLVRPGNKLQGKTDQIPITPT
jgi:hypothetical protein